ncbi:XcbB/CpsF family capsular polysaccharide biosynthesis protein [Staphylococcus sp. ACRSN]|uniref:accessory Sec system protein Asp2 n=1 Tax=Staphylococcus sp. ACRSN TaxID=2918214 RepID=UPI001EF26696|nr:accessory Sec system protein Asp2 [Staphylococcus sp. ACRSN]MCG7338501.1 XcbB/CpsF family capsular polysaccharide biosynthesis protein [Staphylococcus sp. ACRSN]
MIENKIFKYTENIMFENQKRIMIDTGDSENYIQKARHSSAIYENYIEMLKQDYVLYFHEQTVSKFYKRQYVEELFQRKDLIRHNDIFYTLDYPRDKKLNRFESVKLLVLFTCMPNAENYDSSLIPKRMFPKFFDGIERSLVKNVYTMRIMDLNASHGSHYINTINNMSYESDIVSAIRKVQNELNIPDNHTVLYGASKGGTGALYYSAKMNLKSLAVDPIISAEEYNLKDEHFLKHIRKEDLTNEINHNLNINSTREKYIISSENVEFNYSKANAISGENLQLINKKDEYITSHPEVSKNTVPEQLMILNKLLSSESLTNL